MNPITRFVRRLTQRFHFGWAVQRPELRRIRDRQHPRLRLVNIAAVPSAGFGHVLRRDLARISLNLHRPALGDSFRSRRFINVVMTMDVAKHLLPGLGQRRDGQGVGGRSRRHEPHPRFGAEEPAELGHRRRGVVIISIGGTVASVGLDDRRHRLGAQPGVVVAAKTPHRGSVTL